MKPSILLCVALHYLGLASAALIVKPYDDERDYKRCFNVGRPYDNKNGKGLLRAWSAYRKRNFYGDEEGEALQVARKACESHFHGVWRRSTTRERCYNLGRHKHVRLTIELSKASPEHLQSLTSEECYRRLSRDITDCPRGSIVWYGVWRYKQVTLLC